MNIFLKILQLFSYINSRYLIQLKLNNLQNGQKLPYIEVYMFTSGGGEKCSLNKEL